MKRLSQWLHGDLHVMVVVGLPVVVWSASGALTPLELKLWTSVCAPCVIPIDCPLLLCEGIHTLAQCTASQWSWNELVCLLVPPQ